MKNTYEVFPDRRLSLSDLAIDIEDALVEGFSVNQVARKLNVPKNWVLCIQRYYLLETNV